MRDNHIQISYFTKQNSWSLEIPLHKIYKSRVIKGLWFGGRGKRSLARSAFYIAEHRFCQFTPQSIPGECAGGVRLRVDLSKPRILQREICISLV
jgi:hypothetical protein